MKKKTLSLYFSILLVFCQVLASFSDTMKVFAISTAQITNSCDIIRESLKTVRVQDAKTRTYLGVRYDTILNSYMKPLNTRLIVNDIALNDAKTQSDFSAAKVVFAADYIDYQRSLEELLAIDCKIDATSFLKKLTLVREKRKRIAQDVVKLNSLVSNHMLFVKKLKDTL